MSRNVLSGLLCSGRFKEWPPSPVEPVLHCAVRLLSLLNCQAFLPASPQTAFYIVCQIRSGTLCGICMQSTQNPFQHLAAAYWRTPCIKCLRQMCAIANAKCCSLGAVGFQGWLNSFSIGCVLVNMNKFACCDSLSAPAKLELQTCPISNSPCKVFHQKQLLKGCSAPNARQARCMQHLGSFKVQHAFAHCR